MGGTGTGTLEKYLEEIPSHTCGEQLEYHDSFYINQKEGGIKLPDGKIAKWCDHVKIYRCKKCGVYTAAGKEFSFEDESKLKQYLSSLDHKDYVKIIKTNSPQGKISRLLRRLFER